MADNIIENIEDIDTTLNPVTKDHGLEMLGNVSDQPVALRRFSRAIFKIGKLIKGLATGKEDKFSKNGAFNKPFGTTTGTVMEGKKRAIDLGGEPSFSKNTGFNKNKSDAVNSNDSNTVGTSKAVKTAYDRGSSGVTKADAAQTKANQAYTLASGKEPKITKKTGFNLNKSDSVTSTSNILLATAKAVKTAYDKGIAALNLANTNKNAIQNNTEQIENLSYNETLLFDGRRVALGEIALNDNWDNFREIVVVGVGSSYGNTNHRIFLTSEIIPSDTTTSQGDSECTFFEFASTYISGKFRDTDRSKVYITESSGGATVKRIIGINKKI